MTSLSRDLNSAALAFCSTKNELLVTIALSNQTIGYGKISDPLTDKRLAKLTGIRLDRLRPAVNAVIAKGLFDRKPHKRFGYEYSIGKDHLEAHPGKVYTPFVPQSSAASEIQNPLMRNNADLTQMGKDLTEKWATASSSPQPQHPTKTAVDKPLSQPLTQMGTEKQRHTTITNTKTNPSSLQPQQQTETETKKNKPLKTPQQTVPLAGQQSVKLFFNDENAIPSSFAIETSSANTRIEFSFGTTNNPKIATTDKTNIAREPEPPTTSTPERTATLKKLMQIAKHEPEKISAKTDTEKETIAEKTLTKPKQTTPATATVKINNEKNEPWQDDALAAADHLDRVEEQRIAKEAEGDKKGIKTMAQATGQLGKPVAAKPITSSPKTAKKSTVIELPPILGEENFNACYRHFNVLDDEEKKKLIIVFNYNRKIRKINNPAGYFITLAKTAAAEGLTVPPEAIPKQPPTAEQQAAVKEKEYRIGCWSDFVWLQQNAELQGIAMQELARQMGEKMQEAYELFAYTLEEQEEQDVPPST